ncbi:MAG: prolipoprotein diacylglyceryl transferase [Clostridia bacterium]|nr:prolipoprotein diacylglyceryl transferase [Clostridia bacterium]
MLIEDASIITVLGVPVYAYGLFVMLGVVLCMTFLALCLHKARCPKGCVPLTVFCMLLCGFVLSRMLFVLFDGSMRNGITLKNALYFQGGGYSMFGALAGALLGAYAAAKCVKAPVAKVLDAAVTALFLFVALSRIGEGYTDIGISRPLVGSEGGASFFITQGEYDRYISTYRIEVLCALACFLLCLWDLRGKHRHGFTALKGMLVFGCSQTVLESLRFDQHMKFSFVGVQQVLAVVLVIAVVVYLGIAAGKKGRKWLIASIAYLVFMAGAVVLLEFLIDRSSISRLVLYGVYIAVVCVPCVMGLKMRSLAERK